MASKTRLVDYFLERYNQQYNGQAGPLSPQLLRRLQGYSWPGNIRELENLIKRYVILGSEEDIASEILPKERDHSNPNFVPELPVDGSVSLKEVTRQVVREVEGKLIRRVLEATHWNRKKAASRLGISYRALLYKIRNAGIPSKRVRAQVKTEAQALVPEV